MTKEEKLNLGRKYYDKPASYFTAEAVIDQNMIQADIAYQLTRIADTQEAMLKQAIKGLEFSKKTIADQQAQMQKALEDMV